MEPNVNIIVAFIHNLISQSVKSTWSWQTCLSAAHSCSYLPHNMDAPHCRETRSQLITHTESDTQAERRNFLCLCLWSLEQFGLSSLQPLGRERERERMCGGQVSGTLSHLPMGGIQVFLGLSRRAENLLLQISRFLLLANCLLLLWVWGLQKKNLIQCEWDSVVIQKKARSLTIPAPVILSF